MPFTFNEVVLRVCDKPVMPGFPRRDLEGIVVVVVVVKQNITVVTGVGIMHT